MANRGTLTEEQSRLFAVLGLGNPGAEYQGTRHNAGFWVLDAWAELHKSELTGTPWTEEKTCSYLRVRLGGRDLILIRPLRFMNRSGEASLPVLKFFKVPLAHTLIAYDDLDLKPGVARLRFGGSSGGHRGVQDFARVSGSEEFYRLRIGIGHPRDSHGAAGKGEAGKADAAKAAARAAGAQAGGADVTGWVLGRPPKEERELIQRAVMHGAEAIDSWLSDGFQTAQQKLHSVSKVG